MTGFGRQSRWVIALAVLALVCGLRAGGVLRPWENGLADQRAKLLNHEVRSDIVIVEIDAGSLAALDQWPWPRTSHKQLVEKIAAASPRSLFLDIDFSAQSGQLNDAMLESALARPRDFPIYLPPYFQ